MLTLVPVAIFWKRSDSTLEGSDSADAATNPNASSAAMQEGTRIASRCFRVNAQGAGCISVLGGTELFSDGIRLCFSANRPTPEPPKASQNSGSHKVTQTPKYICCVPSRPLSIVFALQSIGFEIMMGDTCCFPLSFILTPPVWCVVLGLSE